MLPHKLVRATLCNGEVCLSHKGNIISALNYLNIYRKFSIKHIQCAYLTQGNFSFVKESLLRINIGF